MDNPHSHGHLIAPHGGELVDLTLDEGNAAELNARSKDFPSWDLTSRQIRDLELLLSGGFSPLRGFMDHKEYERVCHEMRLSNGFVWPIPITLDVPEAFAKSLKPGSSKIALRDSEGVMLAVLNVEDVWQPDRKAEAQAVFGTTSTVHPGVDYLLNKGQGWYVGGRVEGLRFPNSSAYTVGLTRGVRPPGLAQDYRVSDAQSDASRARGIDFSRREPGRSQSSDSSVRRHDPAR